MLFIYHQIRLFCWSIFFPRSFHDVWRLALLSIWDRDMRSSRSPCEWVSSRFIMHSYLYSAIHLNGMGIAAWVSLITAIPPYHISNYQARAPDPSRSFRSLEWRVPPAPNATTESQIVSFVPNFPIYPFSLSIAPIDWCPTARQRILLAFVPVDVNRRRGCKAEQCGARLRFHRFSFYGFLSGV